MSQGLLTHAPQGTELSEDSTTMNGASNADVTFTASLSPVLQLKIFSCHCTLKRESNHQLKIMHITEAQNRRKYKTIIMEIMGSFKPWEKQN